VGDNSLKTPVQNNKRTLNIYTLLNINDYASNLANIVTFDVVIIFRFYVIC